MVHPRDISYEMVFSYTRVAAVAAVMLGGVQVVGVIVMVVEVNIRMVVVVGRAHGIEDEIDD